MFDDELTYEPWTTEQWGVVGDVVAMTGSPEEVATGRVMALQPEYQYDELRTLAKAIDLAYASGETEVAQLLKRLQVEYKRLTNSTKAPW